MTHLDYKSVRNFIFSVLVLLINSLTVFAGGALDGGGASPFSDASKRAWFLEKDRVVKYCILADKNFGVSQKIVSTLLEKSFEKWSNYLHEKKIQTTIANKIEYSSVCENADLVLYLGTENETIRREKLKYKAPIAFVHKDSTFLSKTWSRGFIWLAKPNSLIETAPAITNKKQYTYPDFNSNKKLYAILLHEVGHIMGTGHVPNTIMDESIYKETFSNINEQEINLNIDHAYELAHCSFCNTAYPGIFNDEFLELIAGSQFNKPTKATIEIVRSSLHIDKVKLNLIFDDEEKSVDIYFYDSEQFPLEFFTVFHGTGWSNAGAPEIKYGFFKALNGDEVKVVLRYNMPTLCKNGQGFITIDLPYTKELLPFYLSPLKKKKNLFKLYPDFNKHNNNEAYCP